MSASNSNRHSLSRRQFLRGSLLAGGAALLGPRFLDLPYRPNPELLALQEKIELQFWHQWGGPPNSTALEDMGAKFNKMYPNVTVKLTDVSGATDKITAAIAAGSPPDVVHFVLSTAVPEFAHRGALIDLTPMLDKDIPDWEKRLYPFGRAVATYNNKVYSVASANFNVGLLWNVDIFKEAGLDPTKGPQTLEDLTAGADKLTKLDSSGNIQRMGFIPDYPGFGAGQYVNLVLYGWAFGGEWYDPDSKKITANNPKNIEALKWELSFYQKYGAQKIQNFVKSAGNYLTAQDLFQSGKVAMVYDGEWNLAFGDPKFVPKMNSGGFPAPKSNPSMFGVSYADSDPNTLPTGCPHPKEAWELLKFMGFNADVASAFAQVVANPCQLRDHPQFELEKDPRFEWFVKQQELPSQKIWPRLPVSQSYFIKLNDAEQAVLLGQATPEDALNQVTKEVQDLLDSAGPPA